MAVFWDTRKNLTVCLMESSLTKQKKEQQLHGILGLVMHKGEQLDLLRSASEPEGSEDEIAVMDHAVGSYCVTLGAVLGLLVGKVLKKRSSRQFLCVYLSWRKRMPTIYNRMYTIYIYGGLELSNQGANNQRREMSTQITKERRGGTPLGEAEIVSGLLVIEVDVMGMVVELLTMDKLVDTMAMEVDVSKG